MSIQTACHSVYWAVDVVTAKLFVCEAGSPERQKLRVALADSAGPITPLIEYAGGLDSVNRLKTYFAYFVSERTKTDNLVARGGNTQLFNLEE